MAPELSFHWSYGGTAAHPRVVAVMCLPALTAVAQVDKVATVGGDWREVEGWSLATQSAFAH